MQNTTKRLVVWAVIVGLILLIPTVLTLMNPHARINGGTGGGWDWSFGGDFIFAFVVLFGAALTYELVAKRMNSTAYRCAVGLAVGAALLLLWINAAVGIIGDGDLLDSPKGLYVGVLALGFVSALLVRFRPRGMARVLFMMAVALILVPVIVLVVAPAQMAESPGIVRIFILTTFFALLFFVSSLLFRRADAQQ